MIISFDLTPVVAVLNKHQVSTVIGTRVDMLCDTVMNLLFAGVSEYTKQPDAIVNEGWWVIQTLLSSANPPLPMLLIEHEMRSALMRPALGLINLTQIYNVGLYHPSFPNGMVPGWYSLHVTPKEKLQ